MSLSSINIQPVSGGSENHNKRATKLDYVNDELTHKNYSWEDKSIAQAKNELQVIYKEKIGQKMQKKATPIREGVFLFEDRHTNEELKAVIKGVEQKFGIKAIQLHVHRDEGHQCQAKNIWKPNLHAHVIFEWNDRKTGKSFKLDRKDMSRLQDYFAEELGMQRGKSSAKKHIKSREYKVHRIIQKISIVRGLLKDTEEKEAIKSNKSKAIESLMAKPEVIKWLKKEEERLAPKKKKGRGM